MERAGADDQGSSKTEGESDGQANMKLVEKMYELPEFDKTTINKNTEDLHSLMDRFKIEYVDGELSRESIHEDLMLAFEEGNISKRELDLLDRARGMIVKPHEYEAKIKEFGELWDRLSYKSDYVFGAREYLRGVEKASRIEGVQLYEEAPAFYRGTSIDELKNVLRDGGISVKQPGVYRVRRESGKPATPIDEDDVDNQVSLTPRLDVAMQYGSGKGELNKSRRSDGVVLEYDAESVRKTGRARFMKYGAIGTFGKDKVLNTRWSHQREITVPNGLKGPRLTGVLMDEHAARDNPELVMALKDAGVKLTILAEWSDNTIYMYPRFVQ